MKVFDIWIEGFYYGSNMVKASHLGKMIGYDFKDAVLRWYNRNPTTTFDPVYLKDFNRSHFPTAEEAKIYCG